MNFDGRSPRRGAARRCLLFGPARVVALALAGAAGTLGAQAPPAVPPTPQPPPLPVLTLPADPSSADLTGFLRQLAEASPRVQVVDLGSTEEGRDLVLAVVSAEENLADLDRLMVIAGALADPRRTPAEEAPLLAQGGKPVVLLVGGLEPAPEASPRALMELAHELAAAPGGEPARLRQGVVVLVLPLLDPDGHDRRRDWKRRHPRTAVPVPWRGFYASPGELSGDPALALAGTRAVAQVLSRFHPQRTVAAPASRGELLRLLDGALRAGPELLMGIWVRAERALAQGREESPHGWLLAAHHGAPPGARRELFDLLVAHGVELHLLTGDLALGDRVLPSGSLLVRADQPARDRALALLEGQPVPGVEQVWPLLPGPLPLPALLGARVEAIDDGAVLQVPLAGTTPPPVPRRRGRNELPPPPPVELEPVSRLPVRPGRVEGVGEGVFLLRDDGSPGLVTARVLLGDHQVDAAAEPFRAGGIDYPQGTLLVYAPRSAVEAVAAELGLTFEATLAVPAVRRHVVDLPRVAVVQRWADTRGAGWLRLALDRARFPYQLIDGAELSRGDLRRRFDLLVLPAADGDLKGWVRGLAGEGPLAYTRTPETPNLGTPLAADDVTAGIGLLGLGEIERFVNQGGVLLALGSGAAPLLQVGFPPGVEEGPAMVLPDRAEVRVVAAWAGHPLTYGLGDRTTVSLPEGRRLVLEPAHASREVLRLSGAAAPVLPERPAAPAVIEEEDLGLVTGALEEELLSPDLAVETEEPAVEAAPPPPWQRPGPLVYAGPRAAAALDGAPAIVDLAVGEGRVLLFAFDPFLQNLARSDYRLVWNALLHWNDLP